MTEGNRASNVFVRELLDNLDVLPLQMSYSFRGRLQTCMSQYWKSNESIIIFSVRICSRCGVIKFSLYDILTSFFFWNNFVLFALSFFFFITQCSVLVKEKYDVIKKVKKSLLVCLSVCFTATFEELLRLSWRLWV